MMMMMMKNFSFLIIKIIMYMYLCVLAHSKAFMREFEPIAMIEIISFELSYKIHKTLNKLQLSAIISNNQTNILLIALVRSAPTS